MGSHLGECPVCGTNSGYVNVRRAHWVICKRHKLAWCCGNNLFSNWKMEDESIWQRNENMLVDYDYVDPSVAEDDVEHDHYYQMMNFWQ